MIPAFDKFSIVNYPYQKQRQDPLIQRQTNQHARSVLAVAVAVAVGMSVAVAVGMAVGVGTNVGVGIVDVFNVKVEILYEADVFHEEGMHGTPSL